MPSRKILSLCALLLIGVPAALLAAEGDPDADGVPDGRDDCPYTPPGAAVDPRGCVPGGDQDGDNVADLHDACPLSPRNAAVDEQGCSADADYDGVADGADLCLRTDVGLAVDDRGCTLEQILSQRLPPPATPIRPRPKIEMREPEMVRGPRPGAEPEALASAQAKALVPLPIEVQPMQSTPETADVAVAAPLSAAAPAPPAPAVAAPPAPAASAPAVAVAAPAAPAVAAEAYTLGFSAWKTELSNAQMQQLDRWVADWKTQLERDPARTLVVEGYADRRGEPGRGVELADTRAALVRSYLIARGVPRAQVRSVARGFAEPSGERRGWRVDFRLESRG